MYWIMQDLYHQPVDGNNPALPHIYYIPSVLWFCCLTACRMYIINTHSLCFWSSLARSGRGSSRLPRRSQAARQRCNIVAVFGHYQHYSASFLRRGWDHIPRTQLQILLVVLLASICSAVPAQHGRRECT